MLRLLDLENRRHHGQHDLQIVETAGGLEHGAHLHHEQFRMVEGDADATPAEGGIVLLDGKVR